MALSLRSGLAVRGATGDTLAAADVNQIIRHALAISRVAAQRLGGEGILSGGLFTTGSNWPTFAAVVYDDSGVAWWLGATGDTAMTFTDTSGACTAYLVVKQQTGVTPAAAIGGHGDFQVVVQLTASTAPAHSLTLGAGNVTASAFTTWTEATGVRLNDWTLGSGADVDATLYADNGDANRPGLRYDASSNLWQVSHDGSTWSTIMAVGAAPTAHAASHQNGGGDEIATATPGANAIPKAGAGSTLAAGWLPAASTSVAGAVVLATPSADTTAGHVVQANDTRLSDTRDPKAHATSHQNGGADEIATATPGANAIPKAGAGSTLAAGWLPAASTSVAGAVVLATPSADTTAGHVVQANDTRLSDTRDPKAHATSHQNGGADEVATATAAANAIPKAGAGGTLDSGWLPATIASARTFSGAITASDRVKIIDGLLQRTAVSDTNRDSALLGPPANSTGTASQVGDLWLDLAGALWLCTSAGTPGTWKQLQPGNMDLAGTLLSTTGQAALRTAANWNGGALLNGYRAIGDTSQLWTYDSTLTVWKGPQQFFGQVFDAGRLPITAAANPWAMALPLSAACAYTVFEKLSVVVETAAPHSDASNYYTVGLNEFAHSGAGGYDAIFSVNVIGSYRFRCDSSGSAVAYQTSTLPGCYLLTTKTGSPGQIGSLGIGLVWREAWA